MPLRVHVDDQRLLPFQRKEGRKIDAGGCFSAPTLLVDDRNRPHRPLPFVFRGLSKENVEGFVSDAKTRPCSHEAAVAE